MRGSGCDSLGLLDKRYLIHDRDPLFTGEFLRMMAAAGVESVKLPPRSPNLNAYAERFVRSIKESCLERLIFFGEESLGQLRDRRCSFEAVPNAEPVNPICGTLEGTLEFSSAT